MAHPKEIVMIRSTYSDSGGVERVALNLANGLLDRGIRVTILTLRGQAWPLSHPNLKIVRLGLHRVHRFFQAWFFNHCVKRYLLHYPSNCVLSLDKVTTFTHLHAGGGTHKSFLKIKSNYEGALSRIFRKLSLFHRYVLYIEKKGFQSPTLQKIRCNSKLVLNDIRKDYCVPYEKLMVVYSGIQWQAMEHTFECRSEVGEALCREYHIDPSWNCLLFLGSGFSRKGLDVSIRGLDALSEDFHLIVVGKGDVQQYRRMAVAMGLNHRVHFLGPQPLGWRFVSLSKALVLPSYYDPFGGAAAEGHAMGVPVLVSDKTGYADMVIQGENGIILQTPMSDSRIKNAFENLGKLIEEAEWTPRQFRQHVRKLDDDVVLDELLNTFLNV